MKANVPEKIYVHEVSAPELTEKLPYHIEYTRTDAFIEKALDYIENNIYDHYDGDNEYGICGGYVKKKSLLKISKNI